ncbi:MAG: hypothetical protein CMJ52_10580, partial [Planctomycetaceae bacterium]|nr:hypothetical protein [Planctomycetaceae bacterium]
MSRDRAQKKTEGAHPTSLRMARVEGFLKTITLIKHIYFTTLSLHWICAERGGVSGGLAGDTSELLCCELLCCRSGREEETEMTSSATNKGLSEQNLATLDVNTLTPLSPEVISRQATINLGTIGHVAHGKSTVVKAISGVTTVRFKNELERNITIKLGYANAKIYKCVDPTCPRPSCYKSFGSSKEDTP